VQRKQDVGARDKPGHDGFAMGCYPPPDFPAFAAFSIRFASTDQ
jgi:hypothetical protein